MPPIEQHFFLYNITMKITQNIINFLKLAVKTIHDASNQSIIFPFEMVQVQISWNSFYSRYFHWNVIQDFRIMLWSYVRRIGRVGQFVGPAHVSIIFLRQRKRSLTMFEGVWPTTGILTVDRVDDIIHVSPYIINIHLTTFPHSDNFRPAPSSEFLTKLIPSRPSSGHRPVISTKSCNK